jgi:hypothetical protein
MVGYHSGRQGENWAEYTLPWIRKPRTQEERIVEWLGSNDLHELLIATEALEKQGSESYRILRTLVQHDARRCREGKRALRLGGTLVVLATLAIGGWSIVSPEVAGSAFGFLLLAIWLASPCILSWYEEYRTHGRRLSNTVALLYRIPLPDTAAEMIEALDVGDARTASLAAKSLTRLLPKVTEAEGALLQTKHHSALRRALRGYNSDLILAILKASTQILNQTAIRDVRRLTNCPDWLAESEQIQAAARTSLATLTVNSQRAQTVQTLLRSSSPPAEPGHELLRPAEGVRTEEAHQLLRAGEALCPNAVEDKIRVAD